jgi:hypothetical protein
MWQAWRAKFENRRTRPLPALGTLDEIGAALRPVLAASLARFQAGETGEGRVVEQVRRARLPGADADYCEAIRLFVAEEGRHARILGTAVRALGGRQVEKAWTEAAFRLGRRAVGVRTKLLVLWSAEIAAIGGYRTLSARLPVGPLRSALDQIACDEADHLAFHTDFFRGVATDPTARAGLAVALPAAVTAAGAILWWDHRALWSAIGVGPSDLHRALRGALLPTLAALDPAPAALATA